MMLVEITKIKSTQSMDVMFAFISSGGCLCFGCTWLRAGAGMGRVSFFCISWAVSLAHKNKFLEIVVA